MYTTCVRVCVCVAAGAGAGRPVEQAVPDAGHGNEAGGGAALPGREAGGLPGGAGQGQEREWDAKVSHGADTPTHTPTQPSGLT